MNILLTGGTGFVGSHILMKLLAHGHTVEVLARNPNKIPALHGLKGVTLTPGNMTDSHLFAALAAGKDACIHVALNYNDTSAPDMLRSDTLPSVLLADACARAGVRHFIYTSSTAVNDVVYKTDAPKTEGAAKHNVYEHTKQHPTSYYGATKAATENFLSAISWETGMKLNIVRPGFVFGDPAIAGAPIYSDKRFGEIFARARQGAEIRVTKRDGTQFIAAGDLAEIYLKTLELGVNRTLYFGLAKKFLAWADIAAEAVRVAGSNSPIVVEDKGWGEPIMFDVAAIKRDLGLEFDSWERMKEHVANSMAAR